MKNLTKHIKIFVIVFIAGVLIGSIITNFISPEKISAIIPSVNNSITKSAIFQTSLINILKLILAIFIFGFIKHNYYFLQLILLIKGAFFGTVIAAFTRKMGLDGFAFSIVSILPHHIFLLPLLFIAVFIAINKKNVSLSAYCLLMAAVALLSVLPASIDAFITSSLVNYFAFLIR